MTASQTANRVRVACPCGKKYRCRPDVLGKMFRCRACGDSIKAVEAKRRKRPSTSECPECGEELMPDVELCFACGHGWESEQKAGPADAVHHQQPENATRTERNTVRTTEKRNPPGGKRASTNEDTILSQSAQTLGALLVVVLIVLASSYGLQDVMDGRLFLAFYGVVLAVCWYFSEWNRGTDDAWLPFGVIIITYLAVGVMRYQYGINHGMQKFMLLFLMMIVGTGLIAVGIDAMFGNSVPDGAKFHAFLPGICIGLSVACLLFTVVGPAAGVLLLIPFMGRGGSNSGWTGGCSSGCGGGGGGCGGGGCGGCGG
jgi:ribosomal protein L32/uncharacterized membrane protein YgcG